MNWLKKLIAWFRIPRGDYCTNCPYWRPNIAPIEMGDRNMAYCKFLDKTDIDIIIERDIKIKDFQTEEILDYTIKELTALGFGSLLWDGCKECGIKEYD